MGHLIPAGTGLSKFSSLVVEKQEEETPEEEQELVNEEPGNITESS